MQDVAPDLARKPAAEGLHQRIEPAQRVLAHIAIDAEALAALEGAHRAVGLGPEDAVCGTMVETHGQRSDCRIAQIAERLLDQPDSGAVALAALDGRVVLLGTGEAGIAPELRRCEGHVGSFPGNRG